MIHINNYKVQKIYFFVMWFFNVGCLDFPDPINHRNIEHGVVSAARRKFSFFGFLFL